MYYRRQGSCTYSNLGAWPGFGLRQLLPTRTQTALAKLKLRYLDHGLVRIELGR